MNRDNRDERIIMPDRGVGRDIGQNPTFAGAMPQTRTQRRVPAGRGESVGGYGTRGDVVTSFAATAIGISAVSQMVAVGAGAVKGVHVLSNAGSAVIRLRIGGPGGIIIFAANLLGSTSASQWYGDHGINYNNLYFEVVSATELLGSVWVATTE